MSLSPVDPMRETSQVSMFLVLISEVLRGSHSDKNKGARKPPRGPAAQMAAHGPGPPGAQFPRGASSPQVCPGPSVSPHLQRGAEAGEELGQGLSPLSWPGSPGITWWASVHRARSSAGPAGLP